MYERQKQTRSTSENTAINTAHQNCVEIHTANMFWEIQGYIFSNSEGTLPQPSAIFDKSCKQKNKQGQYFKKYIIRSIKWICLSNYASHKPSTTVICGSGVLGVPCGKEFPEARTGRWDFMGSFIDDVKLRGFPSKVPISVPFAIEEAQSCLQQS